MKKILSTTAIAGSLCLLGTSAFAQFSGPYIGISGSMAGFATDGKKVSSDGRNTVNAKAGVITPLAALDLGYSIAAGKGTTIAVGATYNPMEAELKGSSSTAPATSNTATFEVKDAYTIYVQPTFEINKDAAFFIKGFYSKADISTSAGSGTLLTKPNDLEGWGTSAGLRVMLTKDAFMQVEAVYTQFDSVQASKAEVNSTYTALGGGTGGNTVTRTYTAQDPELVEGRITLGFKF